MSTTGIKVNQEMAHRRIIGTFYKWRKDGDTYYGRIVDEAGVAMMMVADPREIYRKLINLAGVSKLLAKERSHA